MDLPFSDHLIMDNERNVELFYHYVDKLESYDSLFFSTEKKVKNYIFFAKVQVTYDPRIAKFNSLDFAAYPRKRSVDPSEMSFSQRQSFIKSGRNIPQTTRLVSSCVPTTISDYLENIFYEICFHGCRIIKVEKMVRSKAFPIFKNYIETLNDHCSKEISEIYSKILKSLANCLCGKLHQSITNKLRNSVISNEEQLQKCLAHDDFFDIYRLG